MYNLNRHSGRLRSLLSMGTVGPPVTRGRRNAMTLTVAIWLMLTATGLGALSFYAFTGSSPVQAAQQWPTNEILALDPARPVLVLFLHPRCPCSSASITELHRVLSRYPDVFQTYAVLTVPPGAASDWNWAIEVVKFRITPVRSVSV